MNRRDFLKLSAAFGAAFAAGGVPYVFNRISPSKKLRFAEKIPSICLYCSAQCRVNNFRKNGRFISIKGENSSALCPRGLSIPGILNSSESGFKIKRKNSSSWENLGINDAVDFSAMKIKEIRDRDFQSTENGFIVNNLKTIASVMGSSLSNEEAYYITKFMRTLGILYHGSETLLSHDSASECLKDAFGLSASHTDIESINDSCVMLIFGADIAMNNPSLVPHILKAKKKGTFIICVDPVSTHTSSLADIHVRIAPGTDYFFLGALINYLLKNSLENKDFLLNHTDASFLTDSILGGAYRLDERGYPESDDSMRKDNSVLRLLSKELASYTPETAVSTCGIEAGIFLAVSEKISMCNGKTKFLSSIFGGSFCDNSRGFSSAWLLSVLHILGGNVSLPNAGIIWLKSGGNEQGVFDFASGWAEYPGMIPLPDLGSRNPESDAKTYERNNTSQYDTSIRADFSNSVSALMRAFYTSGNDVMRDSFEYIPKRFGRITTDDFNYKSASGFFSAYFFSGIDASASVFYDLMKNALKADFVFISSDSPDSAKLIDSLGSSAADIILFTTKNRSAKKGSFTDSFRRIKNIRGFGDDPAESDFFTALADKTIKLYESKDGRFPDPLIKSRLRIQSDFIEAMRSEISGISEGKNVKSFSGASDEKLICANRLYAGYAEGSDFQKDYFWPQNRRALFFSSEYIPSDSVHYKNYEKNNSKAVFDFKTVPFASIVSSFLKLNNPYDAFYSVKNNSGILVIPSGDRISSMPSEALCSDMFGLPVAEIPSYFSDVPNYSKIILKSGDKQVVCLVLKKNNSKEIKAGDRTLYPVKLYAYGGFYPRPDYRIFYAEIVKGV